MTLPASPWRRIVAWLLDYVFIACYLVLLTAATLGVRASPARGVLDLLMGRMWSAELLGFLSLTLPVVLYFALTEASRAQATLGKRALRIAVAGRDGRRLSVARALLREAIRFAPWELSHALLWRVAFSSEAGAFSPSVAAGFGVVYALVILYVATLFVGSQHRTVYDRLAGSLVIQR